MLVFLIVGVGTSWAADPDYTLDATDASNQGTNNAYASNCDVTVGDITWNVTGNATMSPWRIGGKNLTNTERIVYSKTAYPNALSKVSLEIGAASSVTINSIKLVYSTSSDFSNPTTITSNSKLANTTHDFAPASGNFPAKAYYKFIFNVTIGSSNKFIEFKKVHFYEVENGGAPATPYTVTFNAGSNGTCGTSSLTEASAGAGVTLPAVTPNSGYVFKGWATTSGASTANAGAAGANYKPTSNCTLYAVYGNLYTVTLSDNSEELTQTTEGGNVTLPSRAGNSTYNFAGWSTTSNAVETTTAPTIIPAGNYNPAANVTLYPVYKRVEGAEGYILSENVSGTIYYMKHDGSGTTTKGEAEPFNWNTSTGLLTYTSGSSIYYITHQTSGDTKLVNNTTVPASGKEWTITDNTTNKTVKFNSKAQTTRYLGTTGSGFKAYAATHTLNYEPAGTTYYISVLATQYDVKFYVGDEEQTSLAQKVVEGGNPTTVTEPTKTGYTFDGWYEASDFSGAKIADVTSITISADKYFYGRFNAIDYTITYNNVEGATHSNPATYTIETTTINLTAASKDGFIFQGWFDNEGLTGEAVTTIAQGSTGNKTFWAKWAEVPANPSTVTFNVGEHGTCENASATEETVGAGVALPAVTANEGWIFKGWSTENPATAETLVSAGDDGMYHIAANTTLYAYYKVKPATPAFSSAAGAIEKGTEVTISCTTDGAAIYYTTNGDEPSAESTSYNEAIAVNAEQTIKAIAILDGEQSEVASAAYTIAQHTAQFSINGTITADNNCTAAKGDAITFPVDPEFAEVVFMGWTTSPIVGTQDAEPTMVDKASTTMSTSDITYYAVFATANGGTEGYNNVTSLTVGKKYIFGAVKAAASSTLAANTTFGAVAFTNTYNSTTGGTWGAKVDLTPDAQGSIAADNSSITDACIWTLESVTSGNYAFKNGSNYIYLGTSAGSTSAAQAGVSTTGGNMYIEDVNSTCKNAFLLHPSSTSTNVMLYNTSNGYRMYASRTYTATMSPYVRFYEYDPGTTYTDYCTTVSTKLTPTLSFAEATYEATVGEAFEAPQLTMTEGISVTYSSSETSVATVNATTGEVVLVAAGTTIITATFAGNDDYKPATASYTLNVAAATPVFASLEELVAADLTSGTEVTVTFENVAIKAFQAVGSTRKGVYFDIQKGGNDIEIYYSDAVPAEWVVGGTLSGTLTNCPWKLYNSTWELAPASGWAWANLTYNAPANYAPAFTTQPVSATYEWNATAQNLTVAASGNPAPTYQWYSNTTNSNENGTVIEGQTNVTYKPSTATAGTFYYYCVATNSEGYAASDVAVITVNDPVVASLPFAFDGGRSDIASTDGMSQSGLGSDYNLSPKLKFDSEGDNVVIQYNEAAKKVTYTIKGNSTSGTYAFDVMESADGVNYTTVHSHTSVTDEASYTDNLASTSRFVKFVYTTKASGNVALGKISIVAASVLDDPEFDFEQSTYTFFTDKDMQVVATSAAGSTGAITYALTAGDEDEFLIDENSGEIACYTPGTYTVTATIAETAEFATATATCTVKVLAPVVGNSIIVAETDGGCYAMATTCDGAYFTHKAIKKAGDKYVVNSLDDILFCTHTSDGKTTIQSTSNAQYVQATAAKNISYTETEYLWTNDGEKLTAATADHGTLQYNTSSPRFTTYATKVGQYATIVDLSNVYVGILLDENDTDVEELNNTYETVAVNRTLKADTWNTFCVPFDMSAEDIVSNFGEGAKVKELVGLTVSGVNFNMHFGNAESIEAGKPYMVKVATPVSSIIVNNAYVLTKVDDELYLDDTTVTDSEGNSLTFHGNYAKMQVPMGSFIISSNLFYYVDSEVNNKGFRGYITTEGADGTPAAARSLNYIFSENETEGIQSLGYEKNERIYDAQGRIYNKLQRGVNIVNGKKILK